MTERMPLDYVLQMQAICIEAIAHGVPSLPPVPPPILLSLVGEIIEARAVADGLVDELLAEPSHANGHTIKDRPPDAVLAQISDYWRKLARKLGPSYEIETPVLLLVTLAEELIELRKAPRT
jgi:hypothetical protein